MKKCKVCGSYAINPHCHGREEGVDLDLCDVCYWIKRAQQRDELLAALESLIDMDVSYNRGPKVETAVENARLIIAKVKGGAA